MMMSLSCAKFAPERRRLDLVEWFSVGKEKGERDAARFIVVVVIAEVPLTFPGRRTV